jgi:plastocyanin
MPVPTAEGRRIDPRLAGLVAISLVLAAAAGTALVVGLGAAENSATKDEAASLGHRIAAARHSAAGASQAQAHALDRGLAGLRSQLSDLADTQDATNRGLAATKEQIASLRQTVSTLQSTSRAPKSVAGGGAAGPATGAANSARGAAAKPAAAKPAAAAKSTAPSTLKVSETEFKIDPSSPTVDPGEVTVDVANKGKIPHNLAIQGPSGKQQLASNLAPGASGTLQVNLDQPGTYQWYCPIAGHAKLGMKGTITVR